jgi:hypothetical protein
MHAEARGKGGPPRTTAGHDGQAGKHANVNCTMQREILPVAGPLPFPTVNGA